LCFVQTSAEEKKADIEKIETLEKKLIDFEDLKTKLEATKKAHESDKVSAFFPLLHQSDPPPPSRV
jgi:hypothetical protein